MSNQSPAVTPDNPNRHRPYVPENMEMKELTLRAVLLGLCMTVVLGAANAYLGLRAGITIAATYPAAVIAMAVIRAWKGTLLEENIARTAGSIGEGIAAGAIFTIPAFLIAKAWPSFRPADAYWKSTALIMVGSILGVLFISLVRRVMVEDPELPFPGIGGGGRNPQSRPTWRTGCEISFLEYRRRRRRLHVREVQLVCRGPGFSSPVGSLGHSQVRRAAAQMLPRWRREEPPYLPRPV